MDAFIRKLKFCCLEKKELVRFLYIFEGIPELIVYRKSQTILPPPHRLNSFKMALKIDIYASTIEASLCTNVNRVAGPGLTKKSNNFVRLTTGWF